MWNIYKRNKYMGRENGYVYFQEFFPHNDCDTRITVIGKRAFGYKRKVRPQDFRASGSGNISFDHQSIDPNCVTISFDVARNLGTQSIALDFVSDSSGKPQILEMSYCFKAPLVYQCHGYWDKHLNWFPGHTWPQDAMLIDLLERLRPVVTAATTCSSSLTGSA